MIKSSSVSMKRAFELRLKPTKAQEAAFMYILRDSQETYNAALQERLEAWKLERKSITYNDQCSELAELRKDPQFRKIASDIQREPLRRLDLAFQAFFRRCKNGKKPGFPRFRARDRYNSFAWSEPSINNSAIRVPKIGRLRFRTHRMWSGVPKQILIKRIGNKWIGRVVCDIGPAPEKCVVSAPVGIDLGVTTLITLSDGSKIQNPRWVQKHSSTITRAQKNLERKKRGSNNRIKAKEAVRRAYQRMADARKNYCHHTSRGLVESYDLIVHENLKIDNMIRGYLSKPISDAVWGMLLFQLAYKAESAGRHVIAVNPRNTSQMCSGCGRIVKKSPAQQKYQCVCGVVLGRDHNAALNILALGRSAVESSARESIMIHYPSSGTC